MLQETSPSDMLLAAWPCDHRQGVFIIDDRGAALRALAP
jgi:hypothetical protein